MCYRLQSGGCEYRQDIFRLHRTFNLLVAPFCTLLLCMKVMLILFGKFSCPRKLVKMDTDANEFVERKKAQGRREG